MERGRAITGVLVAAAVIAAFFIVRAKASTDHPSTDQAVAAVGPTAPVPSASSSGALTAGESLAVADRPPLSLPSNYKLSFNAAFSGSKLNTKQWYPCYPWGTSMGCTNFGNTNLEFEWYMASQDRVYDDALHLVSQHTRTAGTNKLGAPAEYACRSGMVTTYKSFQFEYGYIKVVAKIPYATGLWSAVWLAAANFKWPPEVDVLEHWGTSLRYAQYLHPIGLPVQRGAQDTPNLSNGWHDISLFWTPTKITWYIDGRVIMSATKGIPHQSMYLIVNLADSSKAAGTCSGTIIVHSVKIWTPKS